MVLRHMFCLYLASGVSSGHCGNSSVTEQHCWSGSQRVLQSCRIHASVLVAIELQRLLNLEHSYELKLCLEE